LLSGVLIEPVALSELDENKLLLQSGFWGSFKAEFGWQAVALRYSPQEEELRLLILCRRLALGFNLAYIPHGPLTKEPEEGREDYLAWMGRAVLPLLPGGTVFVRFDLPWGTVGEGVQPPPLLTSSYFRKAPMDIQPPNTVIIDISGSEEELLASMKSKTRYNIRLAIKRGVEVSEGSYADLDRWYTLYQETAKRDRITLHSGDYYSRLLRMAAEYGKGAPEIKLFLACHDDDLLAGIIVALKGDSAWYLYGASSTRKRNLMANYALQWRAMQWARERGCRTYDLFGIPPENDPGHPMYGLYRFKTGFGGEILNRYGCYDFVYKPAAYVLYRAAEASRRIYYKKIRHR